MTWLTGLVLAVSVVVYVAAVRERRRIERLHGRRATPLDESRVDEATRRLRGGEPW